MHVEEIQNHEDSFTQTRRDSAGKRHTLLRKAIEIPGEEAEMRYIDVKPANGDESYFYHTKYPKEQVILHFTMGFLKGDIATLTRPNYHVSVPFVLARNGLIYNLFPSMYWSYHLGGGTVGGNSSRSKASIGVEISNIGPLTLDGNRLLTTYRSKGRKDVYCELDQTTDYTTQSFRGYDYFSAFTDAQYESLVVLLRYLTARYNIRRRFLPISKRYATTEETAHFRGIVSHVNFRLHGKSDIGPAFDWEKVIEGVCS